MKPQKDWTDALGDRLKDAQVAPPADGWERLAEPYPIPPLKGREPSSPSFRRGKGKAAVWLAAAAAVLAAVLIIKPFGSTLPKSTESKRALAEANSRVEPERLKEKDGLDGLDGQNELDRTGNRTQIEKPGKTDNLALLEKTERLARIEKTGKPAIQEKTPATRAEGSEVSEDSENSENSDCSENSDTPAATQAAKTTPSAATHKAATAATDRWLADAGRNISPTRRTTADAGHVTVGIRNAGSSGGTISVIPGTPGVASHYSPLSSSSYYSISAAPSLRSPRDYVISHNPEYSLGLMVAYEPVDRLIVESGLTWSILTSQVITLSSTREQRIQYLGLPLYIGWRFIEHGAFSLTACAGPTVERCLSARLGTWKQDEHPWQFSVGAQMGVCYDLGHHFGLAFEPSVNYHLTETRFTTSRTDHPLSLALRFTLQYTL